MGKKEETVRTGRNYGKNPGTNGKKQEETGRNRQKWKEPEETGRKGKISKKD